MVDLERRNEIKKIAALAVGGVTALFFAKNASALGWVFRSNGVEYRLSDMAQKAVTLTSGRIPYVTTGGKLTDIAGLAFDGNTVTIKPTSDLQIMKLIRGTDTSPAANLFEFYKNDATTLLAIITKTGRLRLGMASAAPTIAAGTGAGTTPTISITGSDSSGELIITTGTLPTAAATVCTVTFSEAFVNAPSVVLYPSNANTALLSGVTMAFATATTTTFVLTAGATALTAATAYRWFYHALGM